MDAESPAGKAIKSDARSHSNSNTISTSSFEAHTHIRDELRDRSATSNLNSKLKFQIQVSDSNFKSNRTLYREFEALNSRTNLEVRTPLRLEHKLIVQRASDLKGRRIANWRDDKGRGRAFNRHVNAQGWATRSTRASPGTDTPGH